jgi:NitT/TauT family transport system substrate-binding protein
MKHGGRAMRRIIVLIICSILIAATGCANKPEAKPPIKIALNVWPGDAHAFIAQVKGFFKKNGVEVQLILHKEYIESQQSYINGVVDGIFEVYADTLFHNAEGILTKVVYVSAFPDTSDVIIGKPEFNSLADLKDRVISIEGINTFSHIFVLKAIEKAGLKESNIRFKVVPAQGVLNALEDGIIDAGHTWDPTKDRALQKGYKILSKMGDVPGIVTEVLAFNAKIIRERPKDIQAIVKSILEARGFLYSNREESLKIMSEAEGMSIKEMDEGVRGVAHLGLKGNLKAMQRSADTTSLYGSGEIIADFYVKRGQLSRLPDLDKIIEPRFVEESGK